MTLEALLGELDSELGRQAVLVGDAVGARYHVDFSGERRW